MDNASDKHTNTAKVGTTENGDTAQSVPHKRKRKNNKWRKKLKAMNQVLLSIHHVPIILYLSRLSGSFLRKNCCYAGKSKIIFLIGSHAFYY